MNLESTKPTFIFVFKTSIEVHVVASTTAEAKAKVFQYLRNNTGFITNQGNLAKRVIDVP